jgi:hypothetical protein
MIESCRSTKALGGYYAFPSFATTRKDGAPGTYAQRSTKHILPLPLHYTQRQDQDDKFNYLRVA